MIMRSSWDDIIMIMRSVFTMLQVLAILEEFYVNGDIEDAATTLQASAFSTILSYILYFLYSTFYIFFLASSSAVLAE